MQDEVYVEPSFCRIDGPDRIIARRQSVLSRRPVKKPIFPQGRPNRHPPWWRQQQTHMKATANKRPEIVCGKANTPHAGRYVVRGKNGNAAEERGLARSGAVADPSHSF